MTLKQFRDNYPEFEGYLFITNHSFIDKQLKTQLDSLGVKYLELYLISLETTFLKWFNPSLGINLVYIKDENIIKRYERLGNINNLKSFLEI